MSAPERRPSSLLALLPAVAVRLRLFGQGGEPAGQAEAKRRTA
ncbi:hypothetical protein [Azospirillum sp.]|nr:hypothetical protein [Azospirillum sp.]HYD70663.1 hypothetical protein [Azospirillum sp.]